ncbi:MAG: hypothetical protein NXH88_05535 [Hyphomonas sp.]|nr:hypothetical protein [Hyphomonas sp.]
MADQPLSTDTILISFLSQDDEQSELTTLALVRRMSRNCRILLIEDRDSAEASQAGGVAHERAQRLKQFADRMDLALNVTVCEWRNSLEELRKRAVDDVIVLNPPKSALERQTLVFRQVEKLLRSLPNDVLYTPAQVANEGSEIMAFANSLSVANTKRLAQLAGPDKQLNTFKFEGLAEITQPHSSMRLDLQAHPPAMLLIEHAVARQTTITYSRLAAVLEVPVLVVTPGSDDGDSN